MVCETAVDRGTHQILEKFPVCIFGLVQPRAAFLFGFSCVLGVYRSLGGGPLPCGRHAADFSRLGGLSSPYVPALEKFPVYPGPPLRGIKPTGRLGNSQNRGQEAGGCGNKPSRGPNAQCPVHYASCIGMVLKATKC